MDSLEDNDPLMINAQFEPHPDGSNFRNSEERHRGGSRHSNASG